MTEPQTDTPDEDEISLLELLQVVVENIKLLVLGPLTIGLTALGLAFVIPPTFTATTVIMPPQQQQSGAAMMLQSLGALGGLAGAATGLKNPNDQFVSMMKSDFVADELIARFDLLKRYDVDYKIDARNNLLAISNISSGKDGLITIRVDDKDPVTAAQIANAYPEALSKLLKRLAVTESQQRRLFFEKQVQDTTDKLNAAQLALEASGVDISALKTSPEASIKATAELQALVTAQEVKLGAMRGYLAETAPEYKLAQTELLALQAQFAKRQKNQPSSKGKDADYIAKYRDFLYYSTLFEMFSKQYVLAKVDEAREGAVIQVVDKATPPERKSKPKKALVAILSALAGGFCLLLFVFIRHSLRQAQGNSDTARKVELLKRSWTNAWRNRPSTSR
jgi:tyrosine-protein kinase Etk/Wzc